MSIEQKIYDIRNATLENKVKRETVADALQLLLNRVKILEQVDPPDEQGEIELKVQNILRHLPAFRYMGGYYKRTGGSVEVVFSIIPYPYMGVRMQRMTISEFPAPISSEIQTSVELDAPEGIDINYTMEKKSTDSVLFDFNLSEPTVINAITITMKYTTI